MEHGHIVGVWSMGFGAGHLGRGMSWSATGSSSHYVPKPPAKPMLGTWNTPKLSWGCPYHQCCTLPTDAPWCGHCQRLAPDFAQAASTLRNESSLVRLGKVDATAQTALASEFGITSYPTLKLFRDGNRTHPAAYTGRAVAFRGDAMMGSGVGWSVREGGRGHGKTGGNILMGVIGGCWWQVTAQPWCMG